jgi:DivIVA domain-containing protein
MRILDFDADDDASLGPDSAELIQRIRGARFSTTRLAAGYDERQVDAFLDDLAGTLSVGGQLDATMLRNARFATTRLRPGYAQQDVDTFLREIAGYLGSGA